MSNKCYQTLPSKYIKPKNAYKRIRKIDEGGFGTVELVKEVDTGKLFAKKTIPIEEGDEMGGPIYIFREFTTLLQVHYEGLPLLQLEAARLSENGKPAYIITEYMSGGSLKTLLDSKFKKCKDANTTKMIILYGIAFALKFLHFMDIIHRDLKPANILLDDEKKPYLADFGFARDISKGIRMTGNIGSPIYMAPELVDTDETTSDKSVDVYSFAVVALETITGRLKIKREKFVIPPTVPGGFYQMIQDCLSTSPEDRWTMDKIVDEMDKNELILPDVDVDAYEDYRNKLKKKLNEIMNDEEEENEEVEDTKEFDFL